MSMALRKDEYTQALKAGQKQYKELQAAGIDPNPLVLDDILENYPNCSTTDVGTLEIPAERIIGTKTAGRISAFTRDFLPLLDIKSEFAIKWMSLCDAHLSDVGIREPVEVFEFLGNFYVQEGNKRVSVLRYYGAPRIPAHIKRLTPPLTEDPEIMAYYEFLEFFKVSQLYTIQFQKPGQYKKLLAKLGKEPDTPWTERERRTFSAYYSYFKDAFAGLGEETEHLNPADALLVWLQVNPFTDLGEMTTPQLQKSVNAMKKDILTALTGGSVKLQTEPAPAESKNILERIISPAPSSLKVAFVYQLTPEKSTWTRGHFEGAQYLETIMGDSVTVSHYFHADSQEETDSLLAQAVAEGADLIFTTSPRLSRATLKAAVANPKIKFLNCSLDVPFSSVRTYYSRVYEGKFITGAIAGAMADKNRIGYIGSNPIYGVPASINAFALGAQLTNPRIRIELKWFCQGGNPVKEFIDQGIQVISNRDIPTPSNTYLHSGDFGTYFVRPGGTLTPLGSPVWMWGKFYENVVKSVFDDSWDDSKEPGKAVNYWWGMDSGVIDVNFSDEIPMGVRTLADILRKDLQAGTLSPFARRIIAQDGSVKNDGTRDFSPEELMRMDWLCGNVIGSIPEYDEIKPFSQVIYRELGIHRENAPAIKEGTL